MPALKRFLILSAIGLAIWVAIFHLVPSWRPHLEEEDHFGENLTAVILGLNFLLGLVLAFRLKEKRERLLALGIGLLMGIALGDELSYGERLFALTMPTIGETRFDGLHDIVQIVWDQKWAVILIVLLAAWFSWKYRAKLAETFRWAVASPPLLALLLTFFFTGLALFFDLHIIGFPARHAVEEYFELLAATGMGFTLILLARHGLPKSDDQESPKSESGVEVEG